MTKISINTKPPSERRLGETTMSKPLLLIVDVQNGFIDEHTKHVPENLTRKQRARLQEKIEKRISDLENTYANNEERLNNIKYDLSDKEKAGLWDTKHNLIDRHEESVRQYTIDKLSRHYPRSDEKIRKREAAKWVDTHPDILRVIDY